MAIYAWQKIYTLGSVVATNLEANAGEVAKETFAIVFATVILQRLIPSSERNQRLISEEQLNQSRNNNSLIEEATRTKKAKSRRSKIEADMTAYNSQKRLVQEQIDEATTSEEKQRLTERLKACRDHLAAKNEARLLDIPLSTAA